MKRAHLGEFEEVVLLSVASLNDKAYSVAIVDQLDQQISRKVKLGVVHAILHRLEEKGYLKSELGEPSAERGGKRKRFYSLTAAGFAAIRRSYEVRQQLWNIIPTVVIDHFK
ncbi:helix-turn-helix transcriptional regulator [Fulvivirgaceae bacterium BMA12]|uniref:Helix-turn-helix transcriptional regulator n=1 Tax=Agaribacillus aureus TaxID=3051825 RepID=A0ABT8L866_9BACT|nr:helix-turn-helix transcriptional regulator [Fulvivirgaceae bacterium BMA12]